MASNARYSEMRHLPLLRRNMPHNTTCLRTTQSNMPVYDAEQHAHDNGITKASQTCRMHNYTRSQLTSRPARQPGSWTGDQPRSQPAFQPNTAATVEYMPANVQHTATGFSTMRSTHVLPLLFSTMCTAPL